MEKILIYNNKFISSAAFSSNIREEFLPALDQMEWVENIMLRYVTNSNDHKIYFNLETLEIVS